MSWRDMKRGARAVVHETMRIPAIYIAPTTLTQTPCQVRIHNRFTTQGDLVGFDYAPAERNEAVPQIITETAEVRPERGGIFSVAVGEAYQCDSPMPPDDAYTTVPVTRILKQASLDALPLPEA